MSDGPAPHRGPRKPQDFGGRGSGRRLKTGWLGAPGTQRLCPALSRVCQPGGARTRGGAVRGLPGVWCCRVMRDSAHCAVWPKRPRGWRPKPLPGSWGREGRRVARTNCKLAGLVSNAFAASPLLSRSSLPSRKSTTVSTAGVVLGPRPAGLPGPGRC